MMLLLIVYNIVCCLFLQREGKFITGSCEKQSLYERLTYEVYVQYVLENDDGTGTLYDILDSMSSSDNIRSHSQMVSYIQLYNLILKISWIAYTKYKKHFGTANTYISLFRNTNKLTGMDMYMNWSFNQQLQLLTLVEGHP